MFSQLRPSDPNTQIWKIILAPLEGYMYVVILKFSCFLAEGTYEGYIRYD